MGSLRHIGHLAALALLPFVGGRAAVTTITVNTLTDSNAADVGNYWTTGGLTIDLRGALNYININPLGAGNSYYVNFSRAVP